MPQTKILLDSNSYFRLAKSNHPLLDVEFGTDSYCLYVLKELDDEFGRSSLLKRKFGWVDDEEYYNNRKKRLTISRAEKRGIKLTIDHLVAHKINNQLGISRVDIKCLAHGYVQKILVVTDDIDMLNTALEFEIGVMTTLELMSLMIECGHIDMRKVREIVAYWEYLADKPAKFRESYITIFGEPPP